MTTKFDADEILHEMTNERKHELLYAIWNTLYPDGDFENEWSSDELEEISKLLKEAGLVPDEGAEPIGACSECNGPLMVLGTLGDLRHARCRNCGLQFSFRVCPHGEPIGDCNACDVAGDLAFDAAREDEHFGR